MKLKFKLKLTDGYVISPYIIWGELDNRGSLALGFEAKEDFKNLNFLSEIGSNCQYIRKNNQDYIFLSFALADFTPNKSVFNLTSKKLENFYKHTFEEAQSEMLRLHYRARNLTGQQVDPMQAKALGYIWQKHFNPLEDSAYLGDFIQKCSILSNCLPDYRVTEKSTGFALAGCLHHFIRVRTLNDPFEIVKKLSDCTIFVNYSAEGTETLIHLHKATVEEISQQASEVKETLHSISGTHYYEANEALENIRFFKRTVPGFSPAKRRQYARRLS